MTMSPIVKEKLAVLIGSLTLEEKRIIDHGLTNCTHLGDDSATDDLASELAYSMCETRTQGEALDIAYHVIHTWKRQTP